MLKHGLVSAAMLALLGGGMARAADEPVELRAEKVVLFGLADPAGDQKGDGKSEVQITASAMPQSSEYWIGVSVSEPPPALQAQLDLPKGQGLMIDSVQPDSPAAKAGLKEFDVISTANDKTVKQPVDLVRIVDEVKDGKLSLDVVHAGKHNTITVNPAKRPKGSVGTLTIAGVVDGDMGKVRQYMLAIDPRSSDAKPLEFHVVHPGQILPPGASLPNTTSVSVTTTVKTKASLSDGYTVEIVREDAKPAQVLVTHEKEKWEAKDGDLSKIPEKIRPEVEKLMSPMAMAMGMRLMASEARRPMPVMGTFPAPVMGVGGAGLITTPQPEAGMVMADPRIEKRLAEMNRRIDELRKSVDELRGKAKAKKSEKKSDE